ncbi:MAG: PA2169 family four-helix-bundle protein [Phycisphaerales bacterium]
MLETIGHLDENTIDGLRKLIHINIDSAKGFEIAASKIENNHIAQFFRDCGTRREANAAVLGRYVEWNNQNPPESGTVSGTLHRWWLELRDIVQNGSELAILTEAERGEDAIKGEYETVLKSTAGSPLNRILQEQYFTVKADHDAIREMRDLRR